MAEAAHEERLACSSRGHSDRGLLRQHAGSGHRRVTDPAGALAGATTGRCRRSHLAGGIDRHRADSALVRRGGRRTGPLSQPLRAHLGELLLSTEAVGPGSGEKDWPVGHTAELRQYASSADRVGRIGNRTETAEDARRTVHDGRVELESAVGRRDCTAPCVEATAVFERCDCCHDGVESGTATVEHGPTGVARDAHAIEQELGLLLVREGGKGAGSAVKKDSREPETARLDVEGHGRRSVLAAVAGLSEECWQLGQDGVMSRRGWLLFVAMGVIWGLPYLLIKISVREVAPPMLVEMRTGGAALMLLPIAIIRGELRPVLRHWKTLVVFSLAEICLPWLFLFNAERRLSSSLAGLLVAAVPLAGALLGRITGADRLDRRRLLGVALGLVGVAALVGFDVASSDIWAALSMLVVVCGYALGPWILSRYLSELSALGVMSAALTLCALVYAPIAAFNVPSRSLSTSVITSVIGLTVICTALAFILFFALIAEVGPIRSTVITYLNPAVAVLLGVTVLGEKFGFGAGVGFALIVSGCYLSTGHSRIVEPEVELAGPAR